MGHSQVLPDRRPATGLPDTDATRHLCVGVYLDPPFRDMIIRRVHNDPSHRVAPSAGFDLVPVVKHAWRARVLEDAQHACLLLVLVIGGVLDTAAAVAAACAIGLWHLAPRALATVPRVLKLQTGALVSNVMRRQRAADDVALHEQARLLTVAAAGCAVLVVVPVLVAGWRRVSLQDVVWPAALLLLLMASVTAASGAMRQVAMNRLRRAASLRPAKLGRRLTVIDTQQFHAYVVYQRDDSADQPGELDNPFLYEPTYFVGNGELVHRWREPLVIPLLRDGPGSVADRRYVTVPFPAHALIDHLRRAVERLPGKEVADRVFIADNDVTGERDYLRENPSIQDLNEVIDNPRLARHFLEMRVNGTGELVTTAFLGAEIRNLSLILSFTACLLTSTPEDYHRLDKFGESGKGAVARSMLRGLHHMPVEALRSWRLSQLPALLVGAALARQDRTLVPRRGVTIGARLSVRTEESTLSITHFEENGILGDVEIIEQCLINETESFLSAKNVDTSFFRKRADVIITNVIGMGNSKINIRDSPIGYKPRGNYGGQRDDSGGTAPRGGR